MDEFHDDYPQYEMAHHSEEEGVHIRKSLWRVFFIMLAITIVELVVGFNAKTLHLVTQLGYSTVTLKIFFIGLTLVKAGYIVMSFMHLGHENKLSKWVILGPYMTFILYLIVMGTVGEGSYVRDYRMKMDEHIVKQNEDVRSGKLEHEHEGKGTEKHEEGSEHHEEPAAGGEHHE